MTLNIDPDFKDAIIAALVRKAGGKVTLSTWELEPARDLRIVEYLMDKSYIITAGPEIVDEAVTVVEPLALEHRP